MMGTLRSFTRQHRRRSLTARASGARLADGTDASDGRLSSRLACAHARAGSTEPACRQTRQGLAPPRGVGGLTPQQGRPCYRPGPHAQIFFISRKVLIIFLNVEFSNVPGLNPLGFCDRTAQSRGFIFFSLSKRRHPAHRGVQTFRPLVRRDFWQPRTRFREIRIIFLFAPEHFGAWATLKKRREIEGGGG
jgi:hypothetical protein